MVPEFFGRRFAATVATLLVWNAADSALSQQIRALPRPGWPFHHYGLRYPLQPGPHSILYAALDGQQVSCANDRPQTVVARWAAGAGWADGHTVLVLRTTADQTVS